MHNPNPKFGQARELVAQGRLDQARVLLLKLAQADPSDPHAANLLSAVLARQGQASQALYYAQRAVDLVPGNPELLVTLGNLLTVNKKHVEAQETLRRAVAAAPHETEPRISLAKSFMAAQDFPGAIDICLQAQREGVNDVELALHHAALLQAMGRAGDAAQVLRDAELTFGGHPMVRSHLAFTVNFDPGAAPEEVLAIHRRYGESLSALPPLSEALPALDNPERRLRLGIVSADLRGHSVAYFLEPLLERLDRREFDVVCYHTATKPDELTARFKKLVSGWRDVPTHPPHELARLIRADRIDIAIDLSGHSEAHRLAAFHLRVAPIQATFLGYPATTGVAAIDFRIVDSLTDPPGSESQMVEKPMRLDPCFLCYRPPRDPPPVSARPAGAPVTFGSFSAMGKINEAVLDAWAQILRSAPGSRLILKNRSASQPGVRSRLEEAMRARAIDPARLSILPWAGATRDHLKAYDQIDIALDTFPYNGTTTTCEALFMGVPVVTLVGAAHAGRVGLSLLSAVSMAALATTRVEHYINVAVALAQDRTSLATLRGSLRQRLLSSPLCDEFGYAARFGAALRAAWRERCR